MWDNGNFGSDQYVAASFTADGPATVTRATIQVHGGGPYSATSMSFYSDTSSHPTSAGNLLGTLTYDSNTAESWGVRLLFTGSVSIPSSGTYWLKLTTGTLSSGIWVHFGTGAASSPWTANVGTRSTDTNGTFNNGNYYPSITIYGTSGSGGSSGSSSTSSPPVTDTFVMGTSDSGIKCTGANPTVTRGTWFTLPTADTCHPGGDTPAGSVLLGWSTSATFPVARAQYQINKGVIDEEIGGGRMIYIPAGMATFVSGSNTLYPVWAPPAA
jgi:hypothetical protein